MEEKFKTIKDKIFDIINERLTSDVSSEDVKIFYHIVHEEESNINKVYADMMKMFTARADKDLQFLSETKGIDDVIPENS